MIVKLKGGMSMGT